MELLTAVEAATLLGLQRRQVSELCEAGLLPGAQIKGRMWLIPAAAVEAELKRRQEEQPVDVRRGRGRPLKRPEASGKGGGG